MESGANDPMAIFLTITLVELIGQSAGGLSWLAMQYFVTQMGLGIACGLAGGYLLSYVVHRIDLAGGLYPVFALAAGLTVFGGAPLVDGIRFLAFYLAGLVVGRSDGHPSDLPSSIPISSAFFCVQINI